MRDLHFAIFMLSLAALVIPVYLGRALLRGRARHARTDADGGSVFLHKAAMEMGYWALSPVVDLLVALRVTPNGITLFSLVPGLGAGVAAGFGWFGLACLLATTASLCDILDGLVARKQGVASGGGEVVDAAVDRYVEAAFLCGLVIYYRTHWEVMVLVLGALLGSLIVSYTTAKFEAMGVPPPRGSMRRAERAVYLMVASALTPVTRVLFEEMPSYALRELPIIVAVTVVGVVSNVSAVQRFASLAQALRGRLPDGSAPAPAPARGDAGGGGADGLAPGRTDTPTGLV